MKKLIIIVIALSFTGNLKLQSFPEFECGLIQPTGGNNTISNPFMGKWKPVRTDLSGDSSSPAGAHFPVIIVFVQFQNDINAPNWGSGQAPTYLDSLIAAPESYNNQTNWWDAYNENTQMFSDLYMEISRGKLHVLGKAFSVVLSRQANQYTSESSINLEIWDSLKTKIPDWKPYDKWKKGSDGKFRYLRDHFVDMIFKIHKSLSPVMVQELGYSQLGNSTGDYKVDDDDTISINHYFSELGSGITLSYNGSRDEYIGSCKHELCHYTIANGGHYTYSAVNYGIGTDAFYSPYDMILSHYMVPKTIDFGTVNNVLGDYSSRNSDTIGNLLKVPIENNQFFLIASRNKVSRWDRLMSGDTVIKTGVFSDNTTYGKGLYIYHIENGIYHPTYDISPQDMECADGYWKWDSIHAGVHYQTVAPTCFQSGFTWYYFNKRYPLYSNDKSIVSNSYPEGDGVSFNYLYLHDSSSYRTPKWWDFGEKEVNPCLVGTNRIYTNKNEIYTTVDAVGDRYDAWLPGYNEVFSPYSSPSTCKWNNESSGIFIWYYSYSGSGPGGVANLKIYKTGVGEPISVDSALHLTPPSRPMGLRVLPCDSLPVSDGYKRVKIVWNHNQEPDMIRVVEGDTVKRYKIYRSMTESLSEVPPDALAFSENQYLNIAQKDISPGDLPEFTDTLISICNSTNSTQTWYPFPVRYRVQAVDKYEDASVLSDFANTQAWRIVSQNGGYEEEGRPSLSEDLTIPNEFDLKQNYPNPFNPSTNIQYDLPFDNFVSIKIYNVLGKEIATLVNETKTAGRYIVSFNASNYASGIYYYKIKAGNYEAVRKMIILK